MMKWAKEISDNWWAVIVLVLCVFRMSMNMEYGLLYEKGLADGTIKECAALPFGWIYFLPIYVLEAVLLLGFLSRSKANGYLKSAIGFFLSYAVCSLIKEVLVAFGVLDPTRIYWDEYISVPISLSLFLLSLYQSWKKSKN